MALRPDSTCQCRVPLQDIADHLGFGSLEAESLTQRGCVVANDWAGRPSISLADANRVVPQWVSSLDSDRAKWMAGVVADEARTESQRHADALLYDKVYREQARHGASQAHTAAAQAVAVARKRGNVITRLIGV